jgi:hypothetical protein
MPWQSAALEVRARPFTTVIEETYIVVFGFQRFDFFLDERVEFQQIRSDLLWNREIQGELCSLWRRAIGQDAIRIRR